MHSARRWQEQLDAEIGHALAQGAVGGNAAAEGKARSTGAFESLHHAPHQRLDDRPLVGGGEVRADGWVTGIDLADPVEQRRLESSEGEVLASTAGKSWLDGSPSAARRDSAAPPG